MRVSRVAAVVFTFAAALAASERVADASPATTDVRSPRLVRYRIDARLDEAAHVVAGTATITWRNGTRRPVSQLPFHVHLNAFRDRRTTWARECGLR